MSREHISLELRITPLLLFIFISRKRMFLFCWAYLCGFFSVRNGFVGFLLVLLTKKLMQGTSDDMRPLVQCEETFITIA